MLTNPVGEVASRTTILLPAYNEEGAIGRTIDEIKCFAPNSIVVVVDNNCSDATAHIAKSKGATVITCHKRGKGNAVRSAIEAVSTPYCITMDSDFAHPAKHIPEIMARLERGTDVVIGYRAIRTSESISTVHKVGNGCLSILASVLYGRWVKDICTGMWGFRSEALRELHLRSTGFTIEADMFVNAVRNGCAIEQIPIECRARDDGSQPKLRTVDGLKIGWFLITSRLRGTK